VLGYPGFGDAPPDPSIRSLSDLYDAIVDVVPERFHLVAQSMGNVLAIRMALEHPGRVASFVSCALSGGIDVQRLGGAEWREDLARDQAGMPRWFIDDRSDFTDRLPKLALPVLVLTGERDPLSPVAVGEFLRDQLPSAELCVLAGADHSVANEEPDRVANRIGAFLRSRSI
jgi:poly(3-hydroxyoctanoate) depolymerase